MRNSCLILIFISVNFQVFPQWEFGGSYNHRIEEPENGFGIMVSRNLPFQWPAAGLKLRLGIELYRNTEEINGETIKYLAEDLHLDLIGSFFLSGFTPYAGPFIGLGHQETKGIDEYIFSTGIIAGLKFSFSYRLQPYLEIRLHKYFSSFENTEGAAEISSLQLIGGIGIIIKFDTIR
jgi:hypothetical protein